MWGLQKGAKEIREDPGVLSPCGSPTADPPMEPACLEGTALLFPSSLVCVPQRILSEALSHPTSPYTVRDGLSLPLLEKFAGQALL